MSDSAQQERLNQAEKALQAASTEFENVEKKAQKQWLSDVKMGLADNIFIQWAVQNYPQYYAAETQYRATQAQYDQINHSINGEVAQDEVKEREKARWFKGEGQRRKDEATLKDPDSIKDEDDE